MKDGVLSLLSHSVSALDRRRQLLVLTLHRVGAGAKIAPACLEDHLRYLAAHYEVLTPSQWLAMDEARRPRRTAMVTIDDAHADIHETIFPIAQRFGVPITIAVPTDFFFRGQWLWFDRVTWALEHARPGTIVQLDSPAAATPIRITIGDAASHAELSRYLKRQSVAERGEAVERLVSELGVRVPAVPPDEYRALTLDEMRALLATECVELCAHTATHPILTRVADDVLRTELSEPKRELEQFVGREIVSFCYPNGETGDFDARTRTAVADAGYTLAFTSVQGLNRNGRTDPLAVRRIHAHPRLAVFKKMASGLGELQHAV